MKYILFYKPPCGKWYVHSHKLYDSYAEAEDAAKKFLLPATPIAIYVIATAIIDGLELSE